jgi:tRNA dimethylallyltransferase
MNSKQKPVLVVVLGHTAGGKTAFAARLAHHIGGEIISADSRQVYRGMDIGTGKDYSDYIVEGERINAHLIDIVDAGYEYSLFEFQKDFIKSFQYIVSHDKMPFLCGGTGLYIQSVLQNYELVPVPSNTALRAKLSGKSNEELTVLLSSYRNLHNTTDITQRDRLIRAIEISEYRKENPQEGSHFPEFTPIVFGINYTREERRKRITARLKIRLESGMIEEAQQLMASGLSAEDLVFYGLEYKFLAWYLSGNITYNELFDGLNTAIHQFAKRQMTWFRKMEKEGVKIHWIDGSTSMDNKIEEAIKLIKIEFPHLKV